MQQDLGTPNENIIIAPARFDYRLLQIVLLAFLIGYLLVPFAFAVMLGGEEKNSVWGGLAGPLCAVLVVIIAMRSCVGSWREFASELGLEKFPRLILVLSLPISLVILPLTAVITTLWSKVAELWGWTFDTPATTEIVMNGTAWEVAAFVFTALVAAPFFEEIMFRKAIFEAVNVRFGRPAAYLTASLAFALVHFTLLQLPALTFMALLWQYISRWQRSLWASIILHFWNNLLASVLVLTARYMGFLE